MIKYNSFKRISSLMIALIMVFTMFGMQVTAFAATDDGVIQLSIYSMHGGNSSGSSSGDGLGHAWLVIENGTDNEYDFYNTTIEAGETVSIGTWGNVEDPDTGNVYKGAWLNLEAYYGWGTSNTASLTITINEDQLSAVSDKCIDMNNWTLINNCSYFASKVWNSVAPDDMQVSSYFFPANFPSTLKKNIQKIEGHQTNRAFASNDNTGYCTNDTTFKYIAPSRIAFGSSSSNSSSSSSRSIGYYYTSFPEEYNTMTQEELMRVMMSYIQMQESRNNLND